MLQTIDWFEFPRSTAFQRTDIVELPPARNTLIAEDIGTSLASLRMTSHVETYFAVVLALRILLLVDDELLSVW